MASNPAAPISNDTLPSSGVVDTPLNPSGSVALGMGPSKNTRGEEYLNDPNLAWRVIVPAATIIPWPPGAPKEAPKYLYFPGDPGIQPLGNRGCRVSHTSTKYLYRDDDSTILVVACCAEYKHDRTNHMGGGKKIFVYRYFRNLTHNIFRIPYPVNHDNNGPAALAITRPGATAQSDRGHDVSGPLLQPSPLFQGQLRERQGRSPYPSRVKGYGPPRPYDPYTTRYQPLELGLPNARNQGRATYRPAGLPTPLPSPQPPLQHNQARRQNFRPQQDYAYPSGPLFSNNDAPPRRGTQRGSAASLPRTYEAV